MVLGTGAMDKALKRDRGGRQGVGLDQVSKRGHPADEGRDGSVGTSSCRVIGDGEEFGF